MHERLFGDSDLEEAADSTDEATTEPFWCWQRLIGLPLIAVFVLLMLAIFCCEIVWLF